MGQTFVFFNNRLTAKLNEIIRKPLTVVYAHIGTGKTTALKAYLDNLHCPTIWHSFSGEDFGEYVKDFFRLLSVEMPELPPLLSEIEPPDPDFPERDMYLPNRVAFALKTVFRKEHIEEPMIYALDCPDVLPDSVAEFLYHLSCQRVPWFHIVVVSRHSAFFRFGRLIDNAVNDISESCLLLNQEEIRRGFQRHGVNLSPEESALVFRYSDGWIPIIGKVYAQIRKNGQAAAWNELEALLTPYVSLTLLPETIGYSPDTWNVLLRMCLREHFSDRDIRRVDELLNTPPEQRIGIHTLISNHPAFLYYDERSGSCHTHWVLSSRLLRLFDELPPEERTRIAAAHILYGAESGEAPTEALRRAKMAEAVRANPEICPELEAVWDFATGEYRDRDMLDTLCQVWSLTARYQLKEAEERLNSVPCPAGTGRGLYLILQGVLLVLRGEAESAVRTLEKEMEQSAAAGKVSEAETLSFGSLFLKLFLDADWLNGTEAYCVYAQKCLEKRGNFTLLYDLIFLRMGEYQRLVATPQADTSGGVNAVFDQFFQAAGLWRLRQTERAQNAFAKAVSMARDGDFWLPMLFFHEILGELFNGREWMDTAWYPEFRKLLKTYRSRMKRNYTSATRIGQKLLTTREKEVADCVREKLSNKEIAQKLNISENTVKSALKSVFQKLGVSSRKELFT